MTFTEKPDLLEMRYVSDLWKMLVACVLLNRTKGTTVRTVIDRLFEKWPNPMAMGTADPGEVAQVIEKLGFHNRRAVTLVLMSRDYICHHYHDRNTVAALRGVGRFALEAFDIFFLNRFDFEPEDKELANYLRWRRIRGDQERFPGLAVRPKEFEREFACEDPSRGGKILP